MTGFAYVRASRPSSESLGRSARVLLVCCSRIALEWSWYCKAVMWALFCLNDFHCWLARSTSEQAINCETRGWLQCRACTRKCYKMDCLNNNKEHSFWKHWFEGYFKKRTSSSTIPFNFCKFQESRLRFNVLNSQRHNNSFPHNKINKYLSNWFRYPAQNL